MADSTMEAYRENQVKHLSPQIGRPVRIHMELHGRVQQPEQKQSAIELPEEMSSECHHDVGKDCEARILRQPAISLDFRNRVRSYNINQFCEAANELHYNSRQPFDLQAAKREEFRPLQELSRCISPDW